MRNDETSIKTVVDAFGGEVEREGLGDTIEAVMVFVDAAKPNQFAATLLPPNVGKAVGIGQCEKDDGSPRTTSDKLATYAKKADPISLIFDGQYAFQPRRSTHCCGKDEHWQTQGRKFPNRTAQWLEEVEVYL